MNWMTTFEATPETVAGFLRMFKCERCNKCEQEIGKVYVDHNDVRRLSKHLGMTDSEFIKKHTYMELPGHKLYMTAPCPFFSGDGCTVYEARPMVCQVFPFNKSVKCGDKMMLTVNTGCPAGKKIAENFAINPESVGVKTE